MDAAAQEDDGEPFDQKMARLTATLSDQFAESHRLEAAIRQNLAGLGCPLKTPVSQAWPVQVLANVYRKR